MKQFPYVYRFSDPRYYGVKTHLGDTMTGNSQARAGKTDAEVDAHLDKMEAELRDDVRRMFPAIA